MNYNMIQLTFHLFLNERDHFSAKNKHIVAMMLMTMTTTMVIKSPSKPETRKKRPRFVIVINLATSVRDGVLGPR